MRLVPNPPGKTVGGSIMFKDRDLLSLGEQEMGGVRGKEISMIFQDPMTYLDPVMKIGDQIGEAIIHHQGMRSGVRGAVLKMLEAVRISAPEKVIDHFPHQLSGGMKQRILIAIALSCTPSLIIADEPTTALDVTIQAQIIDLLKALIKERTGLSLLLITHDLGIVAEICDRVYVMYAAKVVEEADVYSIFKHSKHPYTIALLASATSIHEFRQDLVSIEGTVPDLINPPTGCRFHPRCPYAMPKCVAEEPALITRDSHKLACWLHN
jgi:oligopeptide/dipeptide ABC transporter ATP-binding protein